MKAISRTFSRLSPVARWAYGIMAVGLLASVIRGVGKWLRDKPEWYYYRQFAELPLVEATGPDKAIFGYLPGCKAVLAPFVLTGPLGYIVFAALNALACIGVLKRIHRDFTPEAVRKEPHTLLWLALSSIVPIWFTLQNNQLMAPALYLTLVALSFLRKGKDSQMGMTIALAALVKTLPLAIMVFPLALRRWKAIFVTGLALGVLSFGLATMTDGFKDAWAMHWKWPEQVSAQNPFNVLKGGEEPRSFGINQSPGAEIVRLIQTHGWWGLKWVYWLVVGGSLATLAMLSIRGIRDDASYWSRVGGWLAWVAFSAPFGRYYYLLFLIPVIHHLGLKLMGCFPHHRKTCLTALGIMCLAMLGARGGTPVYALATTITLLVYLAVEVRAERRRAWEKPRGKVGARQST